jgi:hypothetical protein
VSVLCDSERVCLPRCGFIAEHELKAIRQQCLNPLPEQFVSMLLALIRGQMIELLRFNWGLRSASLDIVAGRTDPVRAIRDEIAAPIMAIDPIIRPNSRLAALGTKSQISRYTCLVRVTFPRNPRVSQ